MKLQSPWQPWLAEGDASPVDRLSEALADDIQLGALVPGARLPAHRDLAYRLNVAVGTVSKAYAQLERRGLVRGIRGRGVFVAFSPSRGGAFVDLSRNIPPTSISERLFARTLTGVARRFDAGLLSTYPPTIGHEEHRRMMAQWFASLGVPSDPELLILTGGAHAALATAIAAACGPGGTLFTESFTYPGALLLASELGVGLHGLALDDEGILPDALEVALQHRAAGPAALYVTPTLQNPTTATMGRHRRDAIVKICRAHDLWIIEDDVYALAHERQEPTLVQLAPERTFYVNSFSKTLNPALRLGGLVAPEVRLARSVELTQAHLAMVSPILCAVAQEWLSEGTAQILIAAIREESLRRRRLASSILGTIPHKVGKDACHLWIPMGLQSAHAIDLACRAEGVLVTPPASILADPQSDMAGIRLCIGAPSLLDLRTAMDQVARIIRTEAGQQVPI